MSGAAASGWVQRRPDLPQRKPACHRAGFCKVPHAEPQPGWKGRNISQPRSAPPAGHEPAFALSRLSDQTSTTPPSGAGRLGPHEADAEIVRGTARSSDGCCRRFIVRRSGRPRLGAIEQRPAPGADPETTPSAPGTITRTGRAPRTDVGVPRLPLN